jgi:DNA-binding transcriptional MerR regulator
MPERSTGRGSAGQTAVVDDDVVEIGLPDRKYFKIGEVAALLVVEPHVLRYWETQFSQLRPHKARSGHRLYRRREVETLIVIKDLLHVQRFTIAGARQALRQQGTTTLLPRAAEQLTLPPTASVQARHSRVLESTIPTVVEDEDDDSIDVDDDEGDADDVVEFHLADPVARRISEVEVDVIAADDDELEEAMARQLTRQVHPRSTITPVQVHAAIPETATARTRASLMEARNELESLLTRLRRPVAVDGRLRS